MFVEQSVPELEKRGAESLRRVAIVVQVDFHLGEARLRQKRQRVEVFPTVLLGRKEERMAWWPAVCVPERFDELWQLLHPCPDPRALDLETRRAVCGLEMVGDTEQNMSRAFDPYAPLPTS